MAYVDDIRSMVEAAFRTRALLENARYNHAVREALRLLNAGEIRVAEHTPSGWVTNTWVKEAILLYFGVQKMEKITLGPFEWHDKIPIKEEFEAARVRIVPPAVVRYGAFIEAGAVLMPCYVNIGRASAPGR